MGWGKILGALAGVGAAAAGIAAAPFTAGTSLALTAAAGSIAANLAGAKMGSNAAKNAANTQSAAADKSLAFQRQQYEQQRQDFAPYQQQGAAAVGRLGTMATAPRMNFDPNQPQSLGSFGNPMGGAMPSPAQGPPQMAAQGPPTETPQMGGASGLMAPQGQQGGQMVLMQAPDGSQQRVPQSMVQQFAKRGARVIQ